jgi:hypothetical protein
MAYAPSALLRAATTRRPGSRAVASPRSLPPPIGGWNTRDALDEMDANDAVLLDNWYPALGAVTVRPGTASHATGLGGTVETLAEYNSGTTRKLLAAANGSIFDASSSGAVGAALKTGQTSNRWQTANFKAKQFWVNGSDTPITFNGSTFANTGWTGPSAVSDLIGVSVFKNRVFTWEKNTQDFWYAPVDTITGALTKFTLSEVSSLGGNLIAMTTLSYSGGNAPDDLACFIMSSGECIVYQGTDPGDATAWALVGRYRIGTPVSVRAVARFGGDSFITTLQDHVSLNAWFGALRNGTPPPLSKASGAVLEATSANATRFGWQAVVFPQGGKILFNVPNSDGSFAQHVINTATGAWCRYTGIRASCWGLFNDLLYYGTASGVIGQAETGDMDVGSAAIQADGQQAWSKLRSAQRKRVAAFRPVIQSAGSISYAAGVGYDFGAVSVGAASSTAPSGAVWDISPWDTTPWSADLIVDKGWRSAGGSGERVSTRVKVAGLQEISWLATDYMIERGTALP